MTTSFQRVRLKPDATAKGYRTSRLRYNPRAGCIIKRTIVLAALIGLAVSPLPAGGKSTITGAYVEARTAEIFTGASLGTKWSDPDKRSAFFGTGSY